MYIQTGLRWSSKVNLLKHQSSIYIFSCRGLSKFLSTSGQCLYEGWMCAVYWKCLRIACTFSVSVHSRLYTVLYMKWVIFIHFFTLLQFLFTIVNEI